MVKLQLPDFVKAVATAFKQVVQERVMQALSKGKEFASALKGLTQISTPAPLQPAYARTTPRTGPPGRGGYSR